MAALRERLSKHARINLNNLGIPTRSSPSFLILFINSICNMKCEHCFYWDSLNQKDDLSFEEIVALSENLGRLETLNLSGGEPFLREEFADICKQFIKANGVKEIYVPTNGYFTERTVAAISKILEEKDLQEIGVEISLDGMPKYHDEFRKTRHSFFKAMQTYEALAELQKSDNRLQIYAISTATEENMDEIRKLTTFLFDNCPQMAHHHLAIIRGDRKNPSLQGPELERYNELAGYVRRLWQSRDEHRQGSIVDPLLQYVKQRGAQEQRQIVPCRAGVLSAVVYANGDVGVCEQRPPIGNLRNHSFMEIWRARSTDNVRKSIGAGECFCTNEIFMWPSIVFQPWHLFKTIISARAWRQPQRLVAGEKASYAVDYQEIEIPKKDREAGTIPLKQLDIA